MSVTMYAPCTGSDSEPAGWRAHSAGGGRRMKARLIDASLEPGGNVSAIARGGAGACAAVRLAAQAAGHATTPSGMSSRQKGRQDQDRLVGWQRCLPLSRGSRSAAQGADTRFIVFPFAGPAADGTVRNSVREAMMMERRESSHGYG